MARQWHYPRTPRGRFFDYPRITVAPTVPEVPQGLIQQERRRFLFLRRGEFQQVPWGQPTVPPPLMGARHRRALPTRRGEFQWVAPPAAVTAGPGPWIQPPYAQAGRRHLFTPRRGQLYEIPLVGLSPTLPLAMPFAFVTARHTRALPTRRGRYYRAPETPGIPPRHISSRRPQARLRLRDHYFEPPWPAIIPQPSVWRPSLVAATRRRIPLPHYQCRYAEPPWPQIGTPVFGGGGTLTIVNRLATSLADADRTISQVRADARVTGDMAAADRRAASLAAANRDTPTVGTGD